jgi:hypothetical protein
MAFEHEGKAILDKKVSVDETPIVEHYRRLSDKCNKIFDETFDDEQRVSRHGAGHVFLGELNAWKRAIEPRPEAALLIRAAREYQFAMLALVQGHYLHAFKGLRLVLELLLQSVHLSVHTLELHEWLEGRNDTTWSVLVGEHGVFSKRYADAFFPELRDDVGHWCSIAQELYRECSEVVHGNVPRHIPAPFDLAFSHESFELWHDKADMVAFTSHFVLTMRYLHHLPAQSIGNLEGQLLSRLGHIPAIRHYFGAVGGE